MRTTELSRTPRHATLCALLCALAAGFAAPAGTARAAGDAPEPLAAFPQSLLAIRTVAGRVVDFNIWIADTPRRDEQGLMFVRDMNDHAGMLFVFPGTEPLTMWMKNTYMSLDMVFIDARGRIDYIAAHTTPLSLTLISAPALTHAVLELKGGICARDGIRVGDLVLQRSLGTAH